MRFKFVVILVVCLTLIPGGIVKSEDSINQIEKIEKSSNKNVTIVIDGFSDIKKSVNISYKKAEQIKKYFLEIQKDYEGLERIEKQIDYLSGLEIFPSSFSKEKIFSFYDKFLSKKIPTIPGIGFVAGGPMIVTHFTVGGRIHGLKLLKPILNIPYKVNFSKILNGIYLDGVFSFLPVYVGFSFSPVYITAVGYKIKIIHKNLFSPFFEILVPCFGTSVAFVLNTQDSRKVTLFEFNLDLCLAGLMFGFGV